MAASDQVPSSLDEHLQSLNPNGANNASASNASAVSAPSQPQSLFIAAIIGKIKTDCQKKAGTQLTDDVMLAVKVRSALPNFANISDPSIIKQYQEIIDETFRGKENAVIPAGESFTACENYLNLYLPGLLNDLNQQLQNTTPLALPPLSASGHSDDTKVHQDGIRTALLGGTQKAATPEGNSLTRCCYGFWSCVARVVTLNYCCSACDSDDKTNTSVQADDSTSRPVTSLYRESTGERSFGSFGGKSNAIDILHP
jgi:hypothetical protein